MRGLAWELEAQRQRIEAAEQEAASLSDWFDRGGSGAAGRERMEAMTAQAEGMKRELTARLARVREGEPEAVAEWVDWHVRPLREIAAEPVEESMGAARRLVAEETLGGWEAVRRGERSYVGTNWYYLADHQEAMRGWLAIAEGEGER
jgi:hypothetical protein